MTWGRQKQLDDRQNAFVNKHTVPVGQVNGRTEFHSLEEITRDRYAFEVYPLPLKFGWDSRLECVILGQLTASILLRSIHFGRSGCLAFLLPHAGHFLSV